MKSLSKLFSLLSIAVMLLAACAPSTTQAPATQPPATQAPATEMPATEAPATATEAATEAPATQAPGGATAGCPLQVEEGATITFSGWGDETEQKIYRDSIDRFQAVCPGVTVDYQPIPD